MSAFYLKPKFLFSVGGALFAATGLNLGKVLSPFKPAILGGLKEGYFFRDWLISRIELSKEDLEDMIAEAQHMYQEELLLTTAAIDREKRLLENVDELVKKKAEASKTNKPKKQKG